MKKTGAVLLVLLLLLALFAGCDSAQAPAPSPAPGETLPIEIVEHPEPAPEPGRPVEGVTAANVGVEYVDALMDLGQFAHYHSFTEASVSEDLRVIITTQAPIFDFYFVELDYTEVDWGDGEVNVFEHATVLYSLEELTPGVPFVVNVEFFCVNTNRGIVFRDADFNEYFFEIRASGYDGNVFLMELDWRMLRSPRTVVTGLVEDPNSPWAEIRIFRNAGWSAELESLLWEEQNLGQTDAAQLFEILATIEALEILTPFHNEGQHADPGFQIEITYADGRVEVIYNAGGGTHFFRFTGTYGSHGDPGYVLGISETLLGFLFERF